MSLLGLTGLQWRLAAPLVDWTLSDKAFGSSLSLQSLLGTVAQQALYLSIAVSFTTVICAALYGCCTAPKAAFEAFDWPVTQPKEAFKAFVWLVPQALMPLRKRYCHCSSCWH